MDQMRFATCVQLAGLEPGTGSDVLGALTRAGYRNVVTLPSPERIDLASEAAPGVVIVGVGRGADVSLDAVRGLFAARSADVRIVAVAACGEDREHPQALRDAAVAAGASAFLALPGDLPHLLPAVAAVVEVLRAFRELHRLRSFAPAPERGAVVGPPAPGEIALVSRVTKVIERFDPELGRHSKRVAELAARTAAAMGFSDPFCATLRIAARVHDVGKLVVPRTILDAQRRLTPAEVGVVRSHAAMGANLLAGDDGPLLQLAQAVAEAHHEWWDGGGYPRGAAGKDVPVAARIVSVVDAFDAMTNDRVYRRARSRDEAAEELAGCAGAQFDPDAVRALLRVLRQGVGQAAAPARELAQAAGFKARAVYK